MKQMTTVEAQDLLLSYVDWVQEATKSGVASIFISQGKLLWMALEPELFHNAFPDVDQYVVTSSGEWGDTIRYTANMNGVEYICYDFKPNAQWRGLFKDTERWSQNGR